MTFVAIGTHGHMKCVFDGHLKSQDTVLMNLYKRMFPKWTYNPTVLNPPPMLESLQSMATEPSAYQLFDDWVCCFNSWRSINRSTFIWCVLFINSWKAKYLAKHGGNGKEFLKCHWSKKYQKNLLLWVYELKHVQEFFFQS